MARYIIRRVIWIIPVIWIIGSITFALMHAIPGGPWDPEKPITAAAKANIRAKYGLDKPLIQQYLIYWRNFLTLDLGHPYQSPTETVQGVIARTWPASAKLGLMTIVVATGVGIPLGVVAGLNQNTWIDYLATTLSVFGIVTPNFALGIAMVLVFSTFLDWLPPGGWAGPRYWIMPVVTFSLSPMATFARYTRTSVIEVMRQDYVRTAWAKGLPQRLVILRHILRNALVPILTILGPTAGALTTGSIYVEAIFRVPGVGKFFTSSIATRDYPMMMGITMFYAVIVAGSYLLTDISYVLVDPRVDYQ